MSASFDLFTDRENFSFHIFRLSAEELYFFQLFTDANQLGTALA
jgi:hypothetical protein